MPKRVLIFSLAYYPKFVGGAEVAIKEITDRISPEDVEFDMITLRFDSALPRKERIGNVSIYRIGFSKRNPAASELVRFPLYLVKVLYPVLAFLHAIFLHRRRRYDGVWSMMSYMGFPALFLKYLFPKISFLLTLQEGDKLEDVIGRKRIRIVGKLYSAIFKKADRIQTISNYLSDFAKKMGATCPIVVIPNGVDIKKFSDESLRAKSALIRKSIGFWQNDTILITTSRLVPKNAVEDCILALAFLPPQVKLLVIGDGPLGESLKSKVKELSLEERVSFLGYISHEELPEYLHASDIFIRPSLSEGMGNSFIEAMAAGIPVIATPVGGIVDFLKDKETGLLCEVHNPKTIAEAVTTFLEDKKLTEGIVKNAKKMVFESYDWNFISERMKSLMK